MVAGLRPIFLRIRPLNSAGRFFNSANSSSTSDTATTNRAMLSSHLSVTEALAHLSHSVATRV